VTALQPITADTTPPPGTTLYLGGQATANVDWTKVDAYLPNANITSLSATSHADMKPANILCITHSDTDHLNAAATALSREMYFFGNRPWTLLLDRANRATTNDTFSIVCKSATAGIVTTPAIWYGGGLASEIVSALAGYEKYQTENWDGYGAQPITTETLSFACRIMSLLPTSLGSPDVAPAGDGSIALEWIPDDQTHKISKLFLDIGPGREWCAYWRLRDGHFDTVTHSGVLGSKLLLQALFTQLSK
jgi:hypothetical protein